MPAIVCVLGCLPVVSKAQESKAQEPNYRPPAVPLVVHNPFLSIWSCADKLNDDVTRHWTNHPHALDSIIRIDAQSYRLMGNEPKSVPPLEQTSVEVLPTRTIYNFEGADVHVTLTFLTPALPNDIDVLSRPLTYLTWDVKSLDGKPHQVSVLFSASGQIPVDNVQQQVVWNRPEIAGFTTLRMGDKEQPYVLRAGDDSRIDWGYAYIAGASAQTKGGIGAAATVLQSFVDKGTLPDDDTQQPRAVGKGDDVPTMALAIDFGSVAAEPVSRRAMIAYDDIYTVDFFGQKQPGYWRRTKGMDGEKLIALADKEYDSILKRCVEFDTQLMADITKVGGADYAYICALAYRQSLGACGISADSHGEPLLFTKENTSNGNMATVDVIFPMDPVLVFLSPTLAKASLAPVFVYAAAPRWKWPNAPHDLGEYPVAYGKDDGGESMPVEESGNMIILADAICQEEGNTKFVDQWWPQLTQWAKYLEKYGNDPAEQLCTDDFKGTLAHNANLSVKAIVALGAFGDMAKMRGEAGEANRYMAMAREGAKHWATVDKEDDHYKLAFNKSNSWGQNYNMVWDQILGLNLFPASVKKEQIDFYAKHLDRYGLPLDSRDHRTKTDWTIWTASMADSQEEFEKFIPPIIAYLNETTDRVPFADLYETNHKRSGTMHARPVIGGVFARMLTDKPVWKKWADMDQEKTGNWARLPKPPVVTEIVPNSHKTGLIWNYTVDKPGDEWFSPNFDDSSWKKGPAGFGRGSPNCNAHTDWKTDDIWIRRTFAMPKVDMTNVKFYCYHDEDVEIYINGVLAGSATGYNSEYQPIEITNEGKAAFKPGQNVIAAHCHQTTGGQYIDIGIANVVPARQDDARGNASDDKVLASRPGQR